MPFLMTPDQHRRQAQLLREAGDERLARHCENLAKLIEWREAGEVARRELARIREQYQLSRQAPRV